MIIILLFPTLFNTMLPIFRLEVTLTSVYMTRKVFYFHWNFILKVIKWRILFILKGNLGYHFMFTTNMMKYRRAARYSRAVNVVRESIFWYNVKQFVVQSNLVIRNFLVNLKLFLNAKCSLSLWSKLAFGHGKWFLNTNLFLIKPFLITKFDCT